MPNLTLCDKISQNLAQFPQDFSNLTDFLDRLTTQFYEEININHTLLCLSQASYI